MKIRAYVSSDCAEMAKLFYHTVHTVNAADYTTEQQNAWATGDVNLEAWNRSFLAMDTVVAVEEDKIIGFGDMDSDGYLDFLYVHADYQHQGVGTAICNRLEQACKATHFITHASITAKPFFTARGYQVMRKQQVVRQGVILSNYIMKK